VVEVTVDVHAYAAIVVLTGYLKYHKFIGNAEIVPTI